VDFAELLHGSHDIAGEVKPAGADEGNLLPPTMDSASSARSMEESVSGSTIPEDSRTAADALLKRAQSSMSLAGESILAARSWYLMPSG
jgi:hypothetical protein